MTRKEQMVAELDEYFEEILTDEDLEFLQYCNNEQLDVLVETLTKDKNEWNGSQNRIKITQAFLDFVKQTEINIDYLEKNN